MAAAKTKSDRQAKNTLFKVINGCSDLVEGAPGDINQGVYVLSDLAILKRFNHDAIKYSIRDASTSISIGLMKSASHLYESAFTSFVL